MMFSCINKYFFVKLRRKPNIETSLKCYFWLFSFSLTSLQIIINSTMKIIQKFFSCFTFIGNQRANPHNFSEKNTIFF